MKGNSADILISGNRSEASPFGQGLKIFKKCKNQESISLSITIKKVKKNYSHNYKRFSPLSCKHHFAEVPYIASASTMKIP